MKITPAAIFLCGLYFLLLFFWLSSSLLNLYHNPTHWQNIFSGITVTSHGYTFALIYGLLPIIGGIVGFNNAEKWGFFNSSMGKALLFLSLGLISWGYGELIWSYYNFFLKEAVPYPSLADVCYILSYPLWALGVFYLGPATGLRFGLKHKSGKVFLILFPLVMIIFSYYFLIIVARQGIFPMDRGMLKLFFDLAYPIGDVVIATLAFLTYGLSFRYLGGFFRLPIIFLLSGVIINYFADSAFSYTTTVNTFYNGDWVDLLFTTSLFLMSFGVANLDHKLLFGNVQEEDLSFTLSDVEHINTEMYKKSFELSEKNKTLALLQRINEMILNSITHPEKIAQRVVSLLVTDEEFQVASIFLYNKQTKTLQRIACSEVGPDGKEVDCSDYISEIPVSYLENTIAQAINEKKLKISPSLNSVLFMNDTTKQDNSFEKENIKSVFTYSLVVRNELIGAMVIGLKEDEQLVSEYRRDLLNRLAETVGIAIDSALLYNEVQAANARLKVLDKLKTEFVSISAHELRTPMTSIKSYLWMALHNTKDPLKEKQRYYVERGYNSVDRLIRLVNDMLNISRIESGRITIELQSVDLIKTTQEVVDEVLPRATELGVTVTIQKPDSVQLVLADRDKIKEVLFNLIGNSLKFTPKGGTITVSYENNEGMVETRVSDTGAGIPQEDMPKLFQKFGMLEGSYITNQTSTSIGTGLGLFICKAIIDLHHGEIKAESEGRGKGSTFSFTLKKFNDADLHEFKTAIPGESKDKADLIHTQL